jgi:hypothetical protein
MDQSTYGANKNEWQTPGFSLTMLLVTLNLNELKASIESYVA